MRSLSTGAALKDIDSATDQTNYRLEQWAPVSNDWIRSEKLYSSIEEIFCYLSALKEKSFINPNHKFRIVKEYRIITFIEPVVKEICFDQI